MSLLVWLPLLGNLENQGVSAGKIENMGAVAANTSGKIGQCMSFTGAATSNIRLPPILKNTDDFSITCWVKFNTNVNQCLFSQRTAVTDAGFTIFYLNGTSIRLDEGKQLVATSAVTTNTWYHIACCRDSTKTYIYINGVLKASGTRSSTNASYVNSNYAFIGGSQGDAAGTPAQSNANLLNGYLNDYRIYDHCLSAAEVHEISQGLVLHYKLDSPYDLASSIQNKYNSPYSDGQCSGSSFTRTQLTNERGYNYKATFTGTGTSTWYSWYVPAYSFTAGKRYYYSVKIRCNKWTVGSLTLRAARSNNDYGGCDAITICSNGLADGQWHEYVVSEIVNETYVRSGSTVTCNPRMEFYTANMNGNGTVYDMDFDVKDVQVVESNSYISFINNALATSTITDSSGYGHNGEIIGTPTITSDSPRYSSSLHINATSQHIKCGTLTTSGFGNSYSFSWWGKASTFSGTMQWGFNDGIRLNGIYNGTLWNTGDGANNPLYNPGTTTQVTAPTTGVWHHFVMTGDGTTCKVYKDGVHWGTAKTYKAISGTQIYINGWQNGTNYCHTDLSISDFRIYATALSAADVKQLYEVGAKVDNLQNIHAFELNEQSKNYLTIDSAWLNSSGTHNNINWSFNTNYSFTLNGTKSTSTASILIWNFASKTSTSNNGNNVIKNLPNGTYIMYTGHSQATLQVYGTNSDGNDPHSIKTANMTPVVFTIDDTYSYNWVRLHIAANAVFDNFTFYPAIYLISGKASFNKNNIEANQFIEGTKASIQKGNKIIATNFIEK